MITKNKIMKNKMQSEIKVGDIMTRNFVSVKPNTNLRECAKKMVNERTGSLILKEGQKLVGLLSEKDIIWAMTKKGPKELGKIKARDIATKKVSVIKPSAGIYEALQRMKKLRFKRLPVVANGNVIGMITWKDILKIDPSLFADIQQAVRIREESEKFKRMKGERWVKESICEECGNFDLLYKTDNRLLCVSCKEAI